MKFFIRTGAAVCATLLSTSALAQQIPAKETGEPTVTSRLVNGTELEMKDAKTGAWIIQPRGMHLVEFLEKAVKPTITLQSQPTGADVIYTFKNTAETRKPLGMLCLGIFPLGPDLTYQDVRETIESVPVNISSYIGQSWPYPSDLYSPVWAMSNSQYHIGVSLQYPVMVYKHDVTVGMSNPKGALANGAGGPGWSVNFLLSTIGTQGWQQVTHSAELAPGEQRQYVISIRVQPKAEAWVRTLVPYRNYFRSIYGGVKYARDGRAVLGFGLSDIKYFSDTNPHGFNPAYRPDLNGFNKLARELKTTYGGWDRVMIWEPSGLYRAHPEFNFPFQFASPWLNWPVAIASAADSVNGLASVSKSGKDLGLWWGNSARVAAAWDPVEMSDFDPDNPDHVRLAMAEIDTAARGGATTVGLDTFNMMHVPVWKAYPWMESMRLRYPQIKFVAEPSVCDVMHTLSPTFLSVWNDATKPADEEGLYKLKHANYLADFLLPGHEMWAGFRYNGLIEYFHKQPDAARMLADIDRFASYGYVPCLQYGLNIHSATVAAKTWEQTVPADIRLSDTPDPFGPAAAGSSHVALSTGFRADRSGNRSGGNGPNTAVEGWRPTRPNSSDADVATVSGGSSTAPRSIVRVGRVDRRVVLLRPSTAAPRADGRSGVWVVSTPGNSISDAIRRAKESMLGRPAEDPKPESDDAGQSDVITVTPNSVDPR